MEFGNAIAVRHVAADITLMKKNKMSNQPINNSVVASFKAIDHFDIAGRGHVITVTNDKDRPRSDDGLLGNHVDIDGVIYKVRGVESYCIDPIRKGSPVGLLVKPMEVSNG